VNVEDRTFNPYEGHTIARTWTGSTEEMIVTVQDNPGFAPKWETGTPEWEGDVFGGFAVPTALFNNLRPPDPRYSVPRHVGVDFRGSVGAKITSFIHGKVLARGEMRASGFEHMLIIKPLYKDGILYLLAHLSNQWLVNEGDFVVPNQEVAQVGRGRFDPHLHLSVLRTDAVKKRDILRTENSAYVWRATPNYVDPFNHKIPLRRER
jgi:murein DD-endopeptidase MepM/ murein hydrolase activator NlpD